MRNKVKLTERDITRIIRRVIREGVEVESMPAQYNDVAPNMRPGAQTSASLYFDEGKNIMLRVGNANLFLFAAPQQQTQQQNQPAR